MNKLKYSICLKYDPQRDLLFSSFASMSEVLEAHYKSTNLLVSVLDSEAVIWQKMELLQKGSIWAFLSDYLKNTEDERIKNEGIIALWRQFLIEAKYRLIEYCQKKESIKTKNDIENIKDRLSDEAKRILSPSDAVLIESMSNGMVANYTDISLSPNKKLSDTQNICFQKDDISPLIVNKKCVFLPEKIDEELNLIEEIKNIEIVLLVKKPDYISDSLWDFQMVSGEKTYPVQGKVLDTTWLKKFQEGGLTFETMPLPQDALRVLADLKVVKRFENDHKPKVTCLIQVVLAVLKGYGRASELNRTRDFLALLGDE